MRKIILSAIMLLAFVGIFSCSQSRNATSGQSGSGNSSSGKDQANLTEYNILETEVGETLSYLSSDELQGRKTGTEGIEKAAHYIEEVFSKNRLKPYFQTYRDSFEVKGVAGYNLIGYKEGSDPILKNEFIIIGAHYDHIGNGKPVEGDSLANGANDNASGTTAVLELAKYFSDKKTKRSLLFTLYSAEEMGLVGSSHLAKKLKEENFNLYVMFNIEMIGVPMKDKDYLAYVTGFELSNLADKFNDYSGDKVLGFLPQAQEYQLFRRSDNYPFFTEFEVPAQTISTFDFSNYDFYHHVSDEFEEMDVPFMTDLIKKIIPGITAMANSASKVIKMKE